MLGIEKGLEKALKVMIPLPFVPLIVIVIKSLTLDGALEGVKFILQPRMSEITADGVLFALGQSFSMLSLGTTGMVTYASYALKDMTIRLSAISIVVMSISVSVLTGLAIFPALYSFGHEPREGPRLLSKVLPMVFSQVHPGTLFYLGFLALFLFAALTLSISLLELNVSSFTKNDNTKHKKAAVIDSILVFIISTPTTLSSGILRDVRFDVGAIFDNMGLIVSNVSIPLGALGTTPIVRQSLGRKLLQQYFGRNRFRLFSGWYYLIKCAMSVVTTLVFVVRLFS